MDVLDLTVLIWVFSLIFAPFILVVSLVIILAAFDKSFGIRKVYIQILLRIFEWGKQRIERHQSHQEIHGSDDEPEDDQQKDDNLDPKVYDKKWSVDGRVQGVQLKDIQDNLEQLREVANINNFEQSREDFQDGEDCTASTESDTGSDSMGAEEEDYFPTNGPTENYLVPIRGRRSLVVPGQMIERQTPLLNRGRRIRQMSIYEMELGFHLGDVMSFCRSGLEAIVEDEVTQRFDAAELSSWNLLTRTNTNYEYVSLRLTVLWVIGFAFRYFILLPFRVVLVLFAIGLIVVGTTVVGMLPQGRFKKWSYQKVNLTAYKVFACAMLAVITFHNRKNQAKGGGICVANHTSPIDIAILGWERCYAMVGQAHGGLPGMLQRAWSRGEAHIWFQRSEIKDRMAVARRLRSHIEDKNKLPILIFPEGTCINNTSIMMFKKGSFEVGGVIYPAAIKYDTRFADAFWNSSKQSFSKHLLMLMTSWALVCDVWYLKPQKQLPGEDAVTFANRVKSDIALQGGLVDLDWDGGLKRSKPKPDMKQKQQAAYSRRIKEQVETD